MASNAEDQNKPVTGYPSPAGQVVTGYPRAAPPVNDAYFYPSPPSSPYFAAMVVPNFHPRRRDNSSFFCRLTAAMLFVFFIMAAFFLVFWLVLRPRIPEFRLSSVAVVPLNSTASDLTSTWDLSIVVTNPNTKLQIFYDRLDASVFYGDGFLVSQTEMPPFYQANRNQTVLHARLAVFGDNVDKSALKAISDDRRNGKVRFGVRVLGLVRFRRGFWWSRKHLMRVFCYGVEIGYSSSNGPGFLLNPWKECRVEL